MLPSKYYIRLSCCILLCFFCRRQGIAQHTTLSACIDVSSRGAAYAGMDYRSGNVIFLNGFINAGYNFDKGISQNKIGAGIGFGDLLLTGQLDHYTNFKKQQFGFTPLLQYTWHYSENKPGVDLGAGYAFAPGGPGSFMGSNAVVQLKVYLPFFLRSKIKDPGYY